MSKKTIRWLSVVEVNAIHDLQVVEHGGMAGLRDAGLLESAVYRPQQAYRYGVTDLAELAAKLAYGLISDHAFLDGNKRTALVASLTFLRLNGKGFIAGEDEAVGAMLSAATGEAGEAPLIEWYLNNTADL